MPSWRAVAFGVVVSGVVAVAALALILRERRPSVLVVGGLAAAVAPLCWI